MDATFSDILMPNYISQHKLIFDDFYVDFNN